MSIMNNVIYNNIAIGLYIMVLYFILMPTKTISITEYIYFFLVGALVIVPFTGFIQYYLFYNVLSTPRFAGAYLGPLEEITKVLIPVIAVHFHPRRKSMSVTDFILIGVAIGCAFAFVENILYYRHAADGIISRFNIISGSFQYSENSLMGLSGSVQSVTFYNHFL